MLLARNGRQSIESIALVLGRSTREVERRIADLGQRRRAGAWTSDEIGEFKRLYGTRADADLARMFRRSPAAIRRLARVHCLSKDKAFMRRFAGRNSTRMPRWRNEELAQLRELYATRSNLEIAQSLRRSVKSVVSKAHQLGLRKAEARLREMGRANVLVRYASEPPHRVIVPQPAAARRLGRGA